VPAASAVEDSQDKTIVLAQTPRLKEHAPKK
jgi:hypothetical protein